MGDAAANKIYSLRCEFVLQVGLSVLLLCAASLGKLDASPKTEEEELESSNTVNVGAILASDTFVGKIVKTALEMAVEDVNRNPNVLNATLLNVDIRDSTQDAVQGASEALELLRKGCVGIIGPQTSVVAEFVAYLGSAALVPVLTFAATDPSLTMHRYPYFIRMIHSDSMQMKAIAHLVHNYRWRDVVVVYVDDDFGSGPIPALNDALSAVQSKIVHRAAIPAQANVTAVRRILQEELMTLESRVFIVHMHPDSVMTLFSEANKLGMLGVDYVWIITDGVANLLDSFDATSLMSMQGVLGMRNKLPDPNGPKLKEFSARWKGRFRAENPTVEKLELNVYGLIAYDTVWTIANAIHRLQLAGLFNGNFSLASNKTRFLDMKVFDGGARLKKSILLDTKFSGLSGPVQLNERGEPLKCSYDIVNVVAGGYKVVGSWTGEFDGLLIMSKEVVWPGESGKVPRGWVIPVQGKKLKIGVPWEQGFTQFISVKPVNGTQNQTYEIKGFCIDVFKAVLKRLEYELPHEFIPYGTGNITPGYADDLVYQVYLKRFDAIVGDIVVVANRSKYVDFTQPFTETGLVMTVRIQDSQSSDPWAFLRPFTPGMWITTLAFLFFTGVVVWLLEHRRNRQFRGKPRKQVLTFLWFSFSTLFYTQSEKVVSSLGRAVLIIWLFVVLVLVSSYTASLSSMLTIKQIIPEVQSVESLINQKLPIGYRQGSFIGNYLEQQLRVDKNLLHPYSSVEEYAIALNKGPNHGGVAAVFDEETIARNIFLSTGCNAYTTIGPTYRTGGFAFVFRKGSLLVSDMSKAVLNLSESKEMQIIRDKWFNSKSQCNIMESVRVESNRLSLENFWGVFLITGSVSLLTLIYYVCRLVYRFVHTFPEDSAHNSQSHVKSMSTRLQMLVNYADKKEIGPPKRKRDEITVWSYEDVLISPFTII